MSEGPSQAESIRSGVNWIINAIRGYCPNDRFTGADGIKVAATVLACELPAKYIRCWRQIMVHLIETGAMTFQIKKASDEGYWVLVNRPLAGFAMARCPSLQSAEVPGVGAQQYAVERFRIPALATHWNSSGPASR
jgi:hypothetical protein